MSADADTAAIDAASAARRVSEKAPDQAPDTVEHSTTTALKAHFDAAGVNPHDAILGVAAGAVRMELAEIAAALQTMPQHFNLEKLAHDRWRAGVTGQHNKFGHGSTWSEAVEAFVLGNKAATVGEVAKARLDALPKSVQDEIAERDAALSRGEDPVKVAQERQTAADTEAGIVPVERPSIFAVVPPSETAIAALKAEDERLSASSGSTIIDGGGEAAPVSATPNGSPIADGGTEAAAPAAAPTPTPTPDAPTDGGFSAAPAAPATQG